MSGALAFDAAWLFAGLLIIVVLLAAGLTLRRYLLERGGGTVECGLRLPGRQLAAGCRRVPDRRALLVSGVRPAAAA